MYEMTSDWLWSLDSQKYLIYTKKLLPGSKFGRFVVRPTVFKIQGCRKSDKIANAPNDPQNDLERLTVKSQKYLSYT